MAPTSLKRAGRIRIRLPSRRQNRIPKTCGTAHLDRQWVWYLVLSALGRTGGLSQDAADADAARGVECIAGKVVKYLLTQQSSDAFDPGYGGTTLHAARIAASHLPRLRLGAQPDTRRCVDYLSRAGRELPAGAERLHTVTLLGVNYDPAARSGGVAVRIEILTTRGNRALVALP